ncbi:MAG: hypothetical protein QXP70_02815 [Methanomassiliicoccales archaeon]
MRTFQLNLIINTLIALAYWLLFAYSHTMIVYYPESVLPLLKATHEPNPVFFLSTSSLIAFYFSGMEWFPTYHFMFMLLVGDTTMSIITSAFFALDVRRAIAVWRGKNMIPLQLQMWIVLVFALLIASISPLGVILVELLDEVHTFTILQIISENLSYITDPLSALVLVLLYPAFRKLESIGQPAAQGAN